MKRKALIIVSTIAVFVLTVIVACVWLFRARYIDTVATSSGEEFYSAVDAKLNSAFKNKPFTTLKEGDVAKLFADDPYVKVIGVKKVFPDRLRVEVEKRKEKYLVICGEKQFVADDEFILLKADEPVENADELISITVTAGDVDEEKLKKGEKIIGKTEGLFDCVIAIYGDFKDPDLLAGAVIDYDPCCIKFQTKTGCGIKFYFEGTSAGQKAAVCALTTKTEEYFGALSEREKREGNIHVFSDGKIYWDIK